MQLLFHLKRSTTHGPWKPFCGFGKKIACIFLPSVSELKRRIEEVKKSNPHMSEARAAVQPSRIAKLLPLGPEYGFNETQYIDMTEEEFEKALEIYKEEAKTEPKLPDRQGNKRKRPEGGNPPAKSGNPSGKRGRRRKRGKRAEASKDKNKNETKKNEPGIKTEPIIATGQKTKTQTSKPKTQTSGQKTQTGRRVRGARDRERFRNRRDNDYDRRTPPNGLLRNPYVPPSGYYPVPLPQPIIIQAPFPDDRGYRPEENRRYDYDPRRSYAPPSPYYTPPVTYSSANSYYPRY